MNNDEEISMAALESVTVVIPALNEEDSISLVLDDLPLVGRVIVVDNGSVDATAQKAKAAGASVVTEPRRGYGSACLRGLAEIEKLIAQWDAEGIADEEQILRLKAYFA